MAIAWQMVRHRWLAVPMGSFEMPGAVHYFLPGNPHHQPLLQGFLQGLAWLSVSFLFLSLFFALSRKTKRALLVHGILAFLVILFYIQHAEQALKPLLYFFPCFIASFRLLFARAHHPSAMI